MPWEPSSPKDPCFCYLIGKDMMDQGCRCGWCVEQILISKNDLVRENQMRRTLEKAKIGKLAVLCRCNHDETCGVEFTHYGLYGEMTCCPECGKQQQATPATMKRSKNEKHAGSNP